MIEVRQSTNTECGLCCISMAASKFGKNLPIAYYRNAFSVGRAGMSIYDLYEILSSIGLKSRAINVVDITELNPKKYSLIALMKNSHFVMLKSIDSKKVKIFDPATGRNTLKLEDFYKEFDGYVLESRPSETFVKKSENISDFRHLSALFLEVKSSFFIFLFFTMISYILSMLIPISIEKIINDLSKEKELKNHYISIYFSLLFITYVGISILKNNRMVKFESELYKNINQKVISHIFKIPFSYFDNRSEGNILFRLNLLNQIQNVISGSFVQIIISGIGTALILSYFVIYLTSFVLPILLIIMFLIIIIVSANQVLLKKQNEQLSASHDVNTLQTEIINNIFQIKSMNLGDIFKSEYDKKFKKLFELFKTNININNYFSLLIGTITIFGPLIIIVTIKVINNSYVDAGKIFIIFTFSTMLFNQITILFTELTHLNVLRSSLFYINDLLDEKEVIVSSNKKDIDCFQQLNIKNLYFKYSANEEYVLKDVSISIQSGERVAIIGKSGVGKSTILKIITNMYSPEKGSIKINDLDIKDLKNYNEIISVVPQNSIIFNKSIRDNISLGDLSIKDSEIISVLKSVDLYNDFKRMPLGLDTILLNQGSNLSGGQIQRIALARALIKNPELLIIDEGTSALDPVTEKNIYDNIKERNIAVLVITHRISTASASERIYVLEDGMITYDGTHSTLLKKSEYYNAMFEGTSLIGD
ncbi:peptidase domain-containing ABC transporter [Macrococcoides caseolyticum]|uniref:peptidase domain-containing ABC transporter n=1 Tax=Macrococcoides caseolyticum TaxID=69966 RepID=UPI000C33A54E|nr:peptidase domain-containing ABC transporter [Macrococcus caseolyticus]PKE18514.1 hypothetical protein CW679_10670 [Macrococcus caseolyticus]PKF39906.1 hypothetical protein CW661_10955 [Macrococcus caseolyticus]